jgi:RNA polymerase sigma-70 factor (ECF subfamily)
MDDDARLERLHREHAGAVRAFVRRRIGTDDADDVVADVFVVAWRRLGDVPADARIWLLGVARRVLANRYRTAKRQRALYERLAWEAERRPIAGGDPAAAAAGHGAAAVLRALASLGARDREVLLLVTWDGLSHAEAATVLAVRPATLTMRVHRARRRLERALESPLPATDVPPRAAVPVVPSPTVSLPPSSQGAN